MKKRSDQNNPEQKTQNGHNSEFGEEQLSAVEKVKRMNSKKGQPIKSKQRPEY